MRNDAAIFCGGAQKFLAADSQVEFSKVDWLSAEVIFQSRPVAFEVTPGKCFDFLLQKFDGCCVSGIVNVLSRINRVERIACGCAYINVCCCLQVICIGSKSC